MSDGLDASARATHVIAIRHGETDWNAQQRIQGHADIELNLLGRAQAECLVTALRDEPLAAVYASDLSRARATAEPFARAMGLTVRLDAGLRERAFGEFEGRSYAEIEAQWPEMAKAWRRRDLDFRPPGGESLEQFQGRCVQTAIRLAEVHPGQAIALVAHGGVLDALYRAACRTGPQAPRTWQLANAAINRLLLADEGLMLVGWNDCRHLEALRVADGYEPVVPG
jgi:2,3-bisphosphoglycerate-dependent phosphoglycerate mutase